MRLNAGESRMDVKTSKIVVRGRTELGSSIPEDFQKNRFVQKAMQFLQNSEHTSTEEVER